MEPNINAGDTVDVRDGAFKKASDVRRGDVVVLGVPGQPERTFVQRVIGLPGERVVVTKGRVAIHSVSLSLSPHAEVFLEEAGSRSYLIAITGNCADSRYDVTLAADSFVVLGDNRCASQDSRAFGSVPFSAIQGRVIGSEE